MKDEDLFGKPQHIPVPTSSFGCVKKLTILVAQRESEKENKKPKK